MSTIYDISDKVGLSPSTVARALSGKGYVSESAKEAIFQAAKELQYVPVQAAKSLKSKITKKVMLCIPDILNPYYFSMINGVNSVLEENQYYTILVYSNHCPEKELEIVRSLRERFVDGLIMVSFNFSQQLLQALEDAAIPTVLTNNLNTFQFDQKFDCVYVDHTKATYIATNHCLRNGHRKIAFLCGKIAEQTGRERLQGYRMALEDNHIPFDEELVIESDYSLAGGQHAFSDYLDSGHSRSFTAVVSCNDLMGVGCINACVEHGLKPREDFSIVTLDNTDYCICTNPQLSSVDMMQDQIGRNAAQFVLEQIRGERDYKKTVILTPRLVTRDSVTSIDTEDE